MKLSRPLALVVAGAASFALAIVPSAHAATTLLVSGASSVAGIVGDCKTDYTKTTGDSFTYASSSSGGGKGDLETKKVDFAFSDSAYTAPQVGGTIPASLLHIPTFVWPVGVMYNLNTTKQISLSPVTVAKIFSGVISYWDDPIIKADNDKTYKTVVYRKNAKGETVKDATGNPVILATHTINRPVTLPHQKIRVIYRADDSGTSGNFSAALKAWDPTDFPTNNNSIFNVSTMKAAIAAEPTRFIGKNKSAGVAQQAGLTKYSITYAEVNYAALNKLSLANITNANGDLVTPNADSAGGFAATLKMDDATGIVTYDYKNTSAGVYPFTVVTYALVLKSYGDATKAKAVKDAVQYHAFNCSVNSSNFGFIQIGKTTPLGVKIAALIGKLGA
ncbi:MAG: substrate-binding domain-containing protein [Actinomycetes bacterium]